MAENLKVTHYNNGDEITPLTGASYSGGYAIYNDNPANTNIYGNLYNGHAALDDRGLCPEGWLVPNYEDIVILQNFVDHDGGKLKQVGTIEDGTGLWHYPNTGATNISGFNALPAGGYFNIDNPDGSPMDYMGMGYATYFLTSEEYCEGYYGNSTDCYQWNLYNMRLVSNSTTIFDNLWDWRNHWALSVRCLQGIPGCNDAEACNYNPDTNINDGSCEYPEPNSDCEGNIYGCIYETACNYNPDANIDDGSCEYAQECAGNGSACTPNNCVNTNENEMWGPPWFFSTNDNYEICNTYRFNQLYCCGPEGGRNLIGDLQELSPHWVGAFHPVTLDCIGAAPLSLENVTINEFGVYYNINIYNTFDSCGELYNITPLFKLWYGGSDGFDGQEVGAFASEYAIYPCGCQGEVIGCDVGYGPPTNCMSWGDDSLSYETGYNNGSFCQELIQDPNNLYYGLFPDGNLIVPMTGTGEVLLTDTGFSTMSDTLTDIGDTSFPVGGLYVWQPDIYQSCGDHPGCTYPEATNYNPEATIDDGSCCIELWDVCYNIEETTELDLYAQGITGEIPPEIGSLTNLTYLSLWDNQLTGEIPPEIGSLTNLTTLYLSGNQLTGEIPPEIGSLTKLTTLDLYSNQLTGEIPPEIGSLTNLTYLSLWDNQLTGEIPPEIGSLTNLTFLFLSYNQLSGEIPESICNISSMAWIQIYYNNFCPPFPECIEDYVGYQDTSECGQCVGDMNNDGSLNVLDVIMLADCILIATCEGGGDINFDGSYNILDITILVDWVLYANSPCY